MQNPNDNPKYHRDFLSWNQDDFQNKAQISNYNPKYHIYPTVGLLNDPNCIFYYQNQLHIMFQHHPATINHGLKAMSLATISANNPKINYQFLVNQPDQIFDSHGSYSGNAWVDEQQILIAYSGNHRDANWNRIASVVLANFDVENKTVINKRVLFNHLDYPDYTEHFRDPFLFEFDQKFYLLLGAQKQNQKGVILLFQLNQNLDHATLIKEIHLSHNYRMIECPTVAWFDQKAVLIYSPQLQLDQISLEQNPDLVRYHVIADWNSFLNNNQFKLQLNQEKILDHGLEFYAPQSFLINDQWHLIAWSGIPTSLTYPEAKSGWIFCLTMIKKINLVNDQLCLEEAPYLKDLYQADLDPWVKYFDFDLEQNQVLTFFDQKQIKLTITVEKNQVLIKRFDDQDFYPYQSLVKIEQPKQQSTNLQIYFDHSIIEIKINKKSWYTARLYFENNIDFEIKSIADHQV